MILRELTGFLFAGTGKMRRAAGEIVNALQVGILAAADFDIFNFVHGVDSLHRAAEYGAQKANVAFGFAGDTAGLKPVYDILGIQSQAHGGAGRNFAQGVADREYLGRIGPVRLGILGEVFERSPAFAIFAVMANQPAGAADMMGVVIAAVGPDIMKLTHGKYM